MWKVKDLYGRIVFEGYEWFCRQYCEQNQSDESMLFLYNNWDCFIDGY